MSQALYLLALGAVTQIVTALALSHAPEQVSPLSPVAWTKLDAQGKTDLILTSSDFEPVPDDPSDPTSLYIPVIRGGLGDSIRQLGWAIYFAEQNNFTVVDLTHQLYQKHFAGFLSIPDTPKKGKPGVHFHSIQVKSKPPGHAPSATCFVGTTVVVSGDWTPSFYCQAMRPQEWARVLRENVKPLIIQSALVDEAAASGELVVHVRGGDAMTTRYDHAPLETALPPCAFYDKIIDTFRLERRIRILTQSDDLNPCVSEIGHRHPKLSIHVQRGSLNEDAAAIMNARNLVLAPSYMSLMLALMNQRVEKVFYATSLELERMFPYGVVPCGAEGDPQAYRLKVPEIDDDRGSGLKVAGRLKERQDWMVAYTKAMVAVEAEC